jgi:protein JSN1
MVDRMWEVAQGRFGARSMRACLENPAITLSQQRRIATAIILNSIPLATNPNGALLLTWLLDNSNFPSRYNLLAPRFTPHLSHLCTHKLASLTVLRIINQKIEPEASRQLVEALFSSQADHVLTDVLGDQVNGVAVVHKILTSPFIDPMKKHEYMEATKRVLIELKVIATQAYRRLIEEVGLPIPNFQPTYTANVPPNGKIKPSQSYGVPGLPSGYPSNDQGLASMMAALQMGGQNPQASPQLGMEGGYNDGHFGTHRGPPSGAPYSPTPDPYSPLGMRSPEMGQPQAASARPPPVRRAGSTGLGAQSQYNAAPPPGMMGMTQQPPYGGVPSQGMPPQMYQPYMYQAYPQNPQNMGNYHA